MVAEEIERVLGAQPVKGLESAVFAALEAADKYDSREVGVRAVRELLLHLLGGVVMCSADPRTTAAVTAQRLVEVVREAEKIRSA